MIMNLDPKSCIISLQWGNENQPDLYHRILKSQELAVPGVSRKGRVHRWRVCLKSFSKSHLLCASGWLLHLYPGSSLEVYSPERGKQIFLDGRHGHGHFTRNRRVEWLLAEWWTESSPALFFLFGSQNASSQTFPFTQGIGRVFCEESYQPRGKTQR